MCKLRRPQKLIVLPKNRELGAEFMEWQKQNDALQQVTFSLQYTTIQTAKIQQDVNFRLIDRCN